MACTHLDRPSVTPPNWTHRCRECWDEHVQPIIDALPREPKKGKDYEYFGPQFLGRDGSWHREQRLK